MNIDVVMIPAMRMADRIQNLRHKETHDHNDRGFFVACMRAGCATVCRAADGWAFMCGIANDASDTRTTVHEACWERFRQMDEELRADRRHFERWERSTSADDTHSTSTHDAFVPEAGSAGIVGRRHFDSAEQPGRECCR